MARSMLKESRATFVGGRNGLVAGAIAGAVLASIIAAIFAYFEVGAGGPGLHVMTGVVVGGLAGLFLGALRHRRDADNDRGGRGMERGASGYRGVERRLVMAPFPGAERRRASR
jgi:high-affinity Fe2+/Pb2+ permease